MSISLKQFAIFIGAQKRTETENEYSRPTQQKIFLAAEIVFSKKLFKDQSQSWINYVFYTTIEQYIYFVDKVGRSLQDVGSNINGGCWTYREQLSGTLLQVRNFTFLPHREIQK